MPQKVNPEKSDLSVSLGPKLRKLLVEACAVGEISLSQATKEAFKRWLAAWGRNRRRCGFYPAVLFHLSGGCEL